MDIKIKLQKNQLIYIVVLVLYCSWQIFSAPRVFLEGRYFAEEGSIFFSHALSHNFLQHLFFVSPLSGYFLFNANLQTGIAVLLPFKVGPLFTAWSSLALMILPAIFLLKLCVNSPLARIKLLLFTILLFSPYINNSETFANSINLQVYLGLSTFIIFLFFSSIQSKASKVSVWLFLFVSFLSGYYSIILLPILLYRLIKNGFNSFGTKVLLLGLSALTIQISITVSMKLNQQLWPSKLDDNRFSYDYLIKFLRWLAQNFLLGHDLIWFFLLTIILIFVILKFCTVEFLRRDYNQIFYAFILQILLIYFGSAEFSPRYYALVLTIVVFALTVSLNQLLKDLKTLIIKQLSFLLSLLIIVFTTIIFRDYNDFFLACPEDCPSFSVQVDDIRGGKTPYLYHWPMGPQSRDWLTDIQNPKIELAPFQETTMNSN
jgi:hypothetical protein